MKNVNSISLSGKINWDAKVTKTEKCTVVNFPLNFYAGKGKDGAKYGTIQCTSFDENVAALVTNLGKGGKIIVHGNLTSDEYTNKEGNKVTVLKMIVDYAGMEG